MDLNKVLELFARGEINKEKAREMIHAAYAKANAKSNEAKSSEGEKDAHAGGTSGESFRKAFDKIKKTKNIDDFLKASSGLVHQIAEKVPGEIEKIQENVLNDVNIAGFSANIKGVTSKFSIFRNFDVDSTCEVDDNLAVGSQWFAVRFSKKSEVLKNKFTAVQLSEVDVVQSNFSANNAALSRISNVSLEKAKVEANRFSRATLSDTSMTDSDFIGNALTKSEVSQMVMNGSRIAKCQYAETTLRECDFENCNLQGIVFENCRFEECSFSNVQVVSDSPRVVSNLDVVGRTFSGVNSFEAFSKLLLEQTTSAETANQLVRKSREGTRAARGFDAERVVERKTTSAKTAQKVGRKPDVAQKHRVSETTRRNSSPKKPAR